MSETLRYLQSESAENSIEIGTLVKYILLDAVKAGASDVHIEPWESTLAVRIRLNGVLTELVHLPLDLMDKISGRFKVLGNLRHLPDRAAAGRSRPGGPGTGRGGTTHFHFPNDARGEDRGAYF